MVSPRPPASPAYRNSRREGFAKGVEWGDDFESMDIR